MCIYLYWILFYLFFWLSLNPQWIKSFSLHLPKKFKARYFGGTMAMTAISCHFSLEMTPFAAKEMASCDLFWESFFSTPACYLKKKPTSWRIIPGRYVDSTGSPPFSSHSQFGHLRKGIPSTPSSCARILTSQTSPRSTAKRMTTHFGKKEFIDLREIARDKKNWKKCLKNIGCSIICLGYVEDFIILCSFVLQYVSSYMHVFTVFRCSCIVMYPIWTDLFDWNSLVYLVSLSLTNVFVHWD